ncbi:MAG: hypothetical protein KF794_13845 [Xanthobacteraceae bacterium]|nr:hypothetical protein [Xanthobacteraceae bacterium]QYK44821.1 MAG: hypothetical protein KF794_13845 [Xanthobacteraceae bacterium]
MRKICPVLALLVCMLPAHAQNLPKLDTNQNYVEELSRNAPVTDRMEVLRYVLQALPERVKVYPTENYYYFSFNSGGVRYAGNIRLDASDRDEGKLHFAYYIDYVGWKPELPGIYARLGREENVIVEKVEAFLYRVTFGGKSVLFELNDLSNVKPPEAALAPDEQFLGPVFDESGTRFFLVFNKKLKFFLYVLDETVPVHDQFSRAEFTDRILIGTRTGFAYYRDTQRERKILIGVFEANALANNYFDGPFDQLPDNFLKGDELRDAILEVAPELKGKIDRFGGNPDGSERYLIASYALYRDVKDLLPVHQCASGRRDRRRDYYECFVIDETETPPDVPGQKKVNPKGKGAPR